MDLLRATGFALQSSCVSCSKLKTRDKRIWSEGSRRKRRGTYLGLHLLCQLTLFCSLLSLGSDLSSPGREGWRKRDDRRIGQEEKTDRVISACFSSLSSACSFFIAACFVVFSIRSAHDFVLSPGWRCERLLSRCEQAVEQVKILGDERSGFL